MSTDNRRIAVIGLDSLSPIMVERFLAEGRMPNLDRIRRAGWSTELTPPMPPTTPAAWTTVATGAWPSTHGIEGFAVHVPGEPLDKKRHGVTSTRVKAEFIWEVLERKGRNTILLKYPMSWPPRGGERVVQVDGAGGWGGLKCVWDLVHSGCWDTQVSQGASDTAQTIGGSDWVTRDSDNLYEETTQPLVLNPPGVWLNLPAGAEPLWEARLDLRHHALSASVPIYALAIRLGDTQRILIAANRDGAGTRPLAAGDWSDYLLVHLPTPEGVRTGHLRLKLMAFDAAAPRLRLYQAQVHQSTGYTRPEALADELLTAAGPFVEWTESYDILQGWIDDETQLEIYEQHVEWMIRATQHLLRTRPYDLFLTQVHFVDMAYHIYWGAAMPGHPQYDPAQAPRYLELLGRVHELADRFVGAVAEEAGPSALIVVLGDHGHDLYHTALLINHLLLHEGLLVVQRDPRSGEPRINWARSRAYASGYRVFLNVLGRDPQGIIDPSDYWTVQEQVIQALYRVQDPRTGEYPVRMAVRREDAVAIGLYGKSMGDVVFAMAPGYQTRSPIYLTPQAWVGNRLQLSQVPVFRMAKLFREFSGEHDTALPFTRAIRTPLYIAGPGVRNGQRTIPARMVDIAPTLCYYLGVSFPAQCEGSPLWDTFTNSLY